MLFRPATIALLLAAAVDLVLLAAAAAFAVQVLRHWDLTSGSARQIRLERRTYLVATVLGLVLAVEAASLLLFVFNADRMATQFVGAMCAVGTLNAAPWGFPALGLKVALFFAAALWLMVDHLDNRAPDYPLIRAKYALLLGILPLAAAAAAAQLAYFLGLRADVITSCCGSLFDSRGPALSADLAALPPGPTLAAAYALLGATLAAGGLYLWRRRGLAWFCALGVLAFPTALAAIVSAVALYVYEHPHHHCPFCILKPEYHYLGYGLYLPLFAAAALALGLGVLRGLAHGPALRALLAGTARRGVALATALYGLFTALMTWYIVSSNLVLIGD